MSSFIRHNHEGRSALLQASSGGRVMFAPGFFTDVHTLNSIVSELRRDVTELRETVQHLEKRLDKQALLVQVLQGLVLQTHKPIPADLQQQVRQLQIERAIAPPRQNDEAIRAV
jgi:hypothetical protein